MSSDYWQYQRHLFTTLVKWITFVTILAVLANSIWFLWDFWRTLFQNIAALSLLVIAWWCLRVSRRGSMKRPVRIFLATGMILLTLLMMLLSPPFFLNGVMALAVFMLAASFLDSPEDAIFWGFLGMVLYVVVLTSRLYGPVEPLSSDPIEIAGLYIFPVLILATVSVLGRFATGRLGKALADSESVRRELWRTNQALKDAQATLEKTNEQLQVELTERQRAEEALRHSLEETARSHRLLLALSQAAEAVQQARTPEEVYHTVGEEVQALGHDAAVLRLSQDGTCLEISYLTHDADQLAQVEDLTGVSLYGHRIPSAPDGTVQHLMGSGEALFVSQPEGYVADLLPTPLRPLATKVAELLGIGQMVLAPLAVEGQAYGLLAVSGSDLTQADTQAVSAFANQAAVALVNARLYQEVQGWATDLEQRVEERTAELAVSEARYRRLFDSNRDGLYVVDMRGHCLDANPAACQMLGYNREELLGLDVYQVSSDGQDLSREERGRFLERLQSVLRDTVSRLEAELIRKDGEQVPVELSMTPLVFGGQEAALASVRDITQRKQAEEELRASRAQLQGLARQLVSAQEDERKRLAHALHDEAGQALTALKIGLELMSQDLEEPCAFLRPRVDEAVSLTDQTNHRIRLLAQDLRPPALDSLGLSHTLEGLCHDFAQRTRLGVDYQGADLPELPEEVNITLYRFLQEAMTNVARHSGANGVDVLLQSNEEAICLSVEDDGRGFDLQTTRATHGRPQGMGLLGMQERVESLGGQLEVVSEPGQGTRLTAFIPLKEG